MQVRNSQFEKSLLNKVARVANSLEREVENELKVSLKLTFSQLRVLNGLIILGETSQAKLAEALEVTPAVITRQADVLRRQGLVELHSQLQGWFHEGSHRFGRATRKEKAGSGIRRPRSHRSIFGIIQPR